METFEIKKVNQTCCVTFKKELRRRDIKDIQKLMVNLREALAEGKRLFIFDYSQTTEIEECCAPLLNEAQDAVRKSQRGRVLVIEPKREVKEFMMDNRIGRTGEFCQSTIKDVHQFIKTL